jgi:hypothetical protein
VRSTFFVAIRRGCVRVPDAAAIARVLRYVVGALVLIAAVALISGPARGMRSDIDAQNRLVEAQLKVAKTQLEISRQSVEMAQRQLDIAERTLANSNTSLEYQRQVIAIAQATLEQARQLNAKTPDLAPARR